MKKHMFLRLLAVLVVFSLLVVACGGDSGGGTTGGGDDTTAADSGGDTTAADSSGDTTAADSGGDTTAADSGGDTTAADSGGEEAWYPYSVEVWDPPFNMESPRKSVDYSPVESATGAWEICVSFPHMKDAYWMAVDYGVVAESQRTGVNMQLVDAGGYTELNTQISQIEDCVAAGADAVVIGAISFDGLNNLVSEVRGQGVPVIDVINGMSSDELSAKSLVSFGEMGYKAGEYLVDLHPAGSETVKVAWFPGPPGAGWVEAGNAGFMEAVANGAIEVVDTKYGDTGKEVQSKLVEDTLEATPDIDYIVGTAVTAEAATSILRDRELEDQVKILSYYFTPGVYQGIQNGRILAAPTDSAVVQGRIAIDQAVRILEGQEYEQHVGPALYVIDSSNIDTFDRGSSLAPDDFSATFSVEAAGDKPEMDAASGSEEPAAAAGGGEGAWYPYSVEVWDPPFDMESPRSAVDYVPLEAAAEAWDICVSFPHMKDAYWMAVDYGVVAESQRTGVNMQLVDAGGYTELNTQISQIEDCVAAGADAVVIGAISFDGLNNLVSEVRGQGIPVIDVINGMSSDELSAKSLVSFGEMGYKAGEYLVDLHPAGGETVKVAWFPGPPGAGWVEAGNAGFTEAVAAGAIEVVDTKYGDTGKEVQSKLVEDTLEATPDIDYIVGTAVTAEAATSILRDRGLEDQVKILSYYFTPGVYHGIQNGRILAAPTDSAVVQGRIAIDQAVRILEGQEYEQHVGPALYVIDSSNIDTFDRGSSLAPDDFSATFSVSN